MTNSEVIHEKLGDGAHRCMWQVTPSELPFDMPPMALELWQADDGWHLFQFLVASLNSCESVQYRSV